MSELERTRAAWDAEAAAFDEEPDHGLRDPEVRRAWRALLAEVLPPAPSRIADLGCGTGSLATLLAEEGHVVHGVDVSPEMLSRARA
ncbi:MAG TPA: class I SAM-dependent methyltransferase, partial [Nocardioidaceae bacterium]|nr:class I SAM-dependent methyltransferase [Nocardioidaceae bacterium]